MSDTDLLADAIDIHVHCAPDVWPRQMDFLDHARTYRDAGLGGVLFKNHFGSSVAEAYAVNQTLSDFTAYGSLTLNDPAGGLNPSAVEAALKRGADLVYMPTMSSANQIKHWGRMGDTLFDDEEGTARPSNVWYYNHPDGITVLDEDGTLKTSVRDILELIAEHDAVLATGHIGPREIDACLQAADEAGIQRRVITHASFDLINIDADFMKRWARQGVFIEHCAAESYFEDHYVQPEEIAHCVREAGVDRTMISTDAGSTDLPSALDFYREFLVKLRDTGLSEDALRDMTVTNPRRLLADGT